MIKSEIELQLARARELFDALKKIPLHADAMTVLTAHNNLALAQEQVSHTAGLMSHVHPDAGLRAIAEWAEQQIAELATEISLSREIYDLFSSLDVASCSEIETRLITKIKTDYIRSGVDKDEVTRTRIKKIHEELVTLGQSYSKHVREDVRSISVVASSLRGLPEDFIASHVPDADGMIKITTDYPDFYPFMRYSADAAARKNLFSAFHNRAYPQNIPILQRVLVLRHELAGLLGFPNWAAFITADKMIGSEAAVRTFISEIVTRAKSRAEKERDILLAEKKFDDQAANELHEWDKSFYENKFKERTLAFNSQEVREYFSYENVERGLLELVSELYGITFVRDDAAAVWHESVRAYTVHRGAEKIGVIYLDMHPREAKYKHAAQFPLHSGVRGTQLPEGALVCNVGTELIDHDQVVTLFHEFGHLMHHILGGAVQWQYFSGVATEWDFVEAPSQLFEEWAWDAAVLKRFARHHITQVLIPDELVARMRRADEWGNGLFAARQMVFAAISLELHAQPPQDDADMEARIAELVGLYGLFPHTDDNHISANFEHLIGYNALYYTYMWSLVISKDLLSGFDKNNLLDPTRAQKYAAEILQPGGTADAADLIKKFLGREYSFAAFNEWLA